MKPGYTVLLGLFVSPWVNSLTLELPYNGDTLVGEDYVVAARHEDTLVDIARLYGLGFDEIINANPAVDAWLPREGTQVMIPHRYLLPATPQEGIVVNTAEMRLYYYPPAKAGDPRKVETFPISIGRSDWSTPLVTTSVASKVKDPVWRPPESIKDEHAKEGDILPDVVTAGPDNPLGQHALYLGIPSYLIHGTNKEYGIGMQVTHGCMRMYPEDIEHLFNAVPVGTPVRIVNQPYKTGWLDNVLYLEVHPWLEGTPAQQANDKMLLVELILSALGEYPDYEVDWSTVEIARIEANGQPIAIGPERQEKVIDDFAW